MEQKKIYKVYNKVSEFYFSTYENAIKFVLANGNNFGTASFKIIEVILN